MVSPEPGEVFIESLLATPAEPLETTENDDVPDHEDFEDDRSNFTTESVDDPSLTDIYGLPELPPGYEQGFAADIQPPQNEAAGGFAPNENAIFMAPPRMATATDIFGNIEVPPGDEDSAKPENQNEPSPSFFENDTALKRTQSTSADLFGV